MMQLAFDFAPDAVALECPSWLGVSPFTGAYDLKWRRWYLDADYRNDPDREYLGAQDTFPGERPGYRQSKTSRNSQDRNWEMAG